MTVSDAASGSLLGAGQVSFVDRYGHGLSDGTYTISARLTVKAPGADVPTASQQIVVSGPRFALDPADVYSQHPPAAASGPFSGVLPHVVFSKRLLPWERALPPVDPEDGGTPWVALLAFQPDELQPDELQPGKRQADYAETMSVSDLLAQKETESVLVPDITPTPDEAKLRCQVITITNETFARVVPTRRELSLLAHGRSVAQAGQASFTDLQRPGEFSVVMANRFPRPGTEAGAAPCVMHLVSLEGYGDLIAGTAPVKPAQSRVKLVSLFSWTFGCLADDDGQAASRRPRAFGDLARQLAYDGEAQRPAGTLLLRLPFTPPAASNPAATYVRDRLGDGYVALDYHARSGERGFAWYRGPLPPVESKQVTAAQRTSRSVFTSADAAMIFDGDNGIFDLSLAAAWSCGRSLALSDESYVAALTRLRRRARDQIHAKTVGNADLPGGVGPAQPALAAVIRAGVLQRIRTAAAGEALSQPAPQPAGPPPPAPVQRLRALIADPQTRQAVTDSLDNDPDAKAVAAWLGRLLLLNGVPFDHLVPDARMLPSGAIRFGYLDQSWIWSMASGALAIGLAASQESSVQDILTGKLMDLAADSTLPARFGDLGPGIAPGPDSTVTGFLLRSPIVTGWPGTTVRGTRGGTAVTSLRQDVVRPDVLVAIFAGVPDTIVIEEPHEGLAFGADPHGKITTRKWNGSALTGGSPGHDYPPPLRQEDARVLNVNSGQPNDLVGLIAAGLGAERLAITSATVALQLLMEPEQVTFTVTEPGGPA
jgi:hypothetical protein